jgi:3-dehydroquinate dehydratase-2
MGKIAPFSSKNPVTMQTKVLVLNGPNLNLLGQREAHFYGSATLADINHQLSELGHELKLQVQCLQSNAEHELVGWIQATDADFILINAAAYTHTSIALRDALLGVACPFVEVHLSNPLAREPFRHQSYLSDIAVGVISGFGAQSYLLALRAAASYLSNK